MHPNGKDDGRHAAYSVCIEYNDRPRYAYHPQMFITTPPSPIKLGHIRLHHAIIKRGHKRCKLTKN